MSWQAARAASTTSLGFGPALVPPNPFGWSMVKVKSRIFTVLRNPPLFSLRTFT
jgi:hypothetical protein